MGQFEYTDGSIEFEGYVCVDPRDDQKRPCILIAHAWDGPNEHFNQMAEAYANKGYVGFAIDVYGKGVRGKIEGDNSHLMNPLLADRNLLKSRLLAAFRAAHRIPQVDTNKIIIIGHCFGGLCALDLARSASKGLIGAIAVHAPLHAPNLLEQRKVTASILVLHGWEDPVATPDAVSGFASEMTKAGADWQIHAYGHARHAFTFVGANIPALGIKYDAKAHQRSSQAMETFLAELCGKNFKTEF